jgi:hypothetical protein
MRNPLRILPRRRGSFLSKRLYCNEQRDVVIYLVRLLRGERLEEIGKQFGMVSSDN